MFPKQTQLFEQQLQELINNSGLTVVEAYYIVKSAYLELRLLYQQSIYADINNNNNNTVEITEEIPLEVESEVQLTEPGTDKN